MRWASTSANWLVTSMVAVVGTVVGVLVLLFGQSQLAPFLAGGPTTVCGEPDCALGVGLWLFVGGFAVVLVSLIAGVVLGVRGRDRPRPVRRGLLVCAWCLLAYFAESVVLWTVV